MRYCQARQPGLVVARTWPVGCLVMNKIVALPGRDPGSALQVLRPSADSPGVRASPIGRGLPESWASPTIWHPVGGRRPPTSSHDRVCRAGDASRVPAPHVASRRRVWVARRDTAPPFKVLVDLVRRRPIAAPRRIVSQSISSAAVPCATQATPGATVRRVVNLRRSFPHVRCRSWPRQPP